MDTCRRTFPLRRPDGTVWQATLAPDPTIRREPICGEDADPCGGSAFLLTLRDSAGKTLGAVPLSKPTYGPCLVPSGDFNVVALGPHEDGIALTGESGSTMVGNSAGRSFTHYVTIDPSTWQLADLGLEVSTDYGEFSCNDPGQEIPCETRAGRLEALAADASGRFRFARTVETREWEEAAGPPDPRGDVRPQRFVERSVRQICAFDAGAARFVCRPAAG